MTSIVIKFLYINNINIMYIIQFKNILFRIRIWDIRLASNKANMLTIANAHDNDINVINWNKKEPLIISGGDDGKLIIWDLRQFKVYSFMH